MTSRKLASWVDAFLDYTENRPSPPLFRKWAAISTIAGALERKVWLRVQSMDLFPNLYVLLVGPPAVGKTVMTSEVEKLWTALEDHHLASSDIKQASLIDELDAAQRRIVRANCVPSITSFNSLLIASNELGSLIPAYDPSMMNALTDIYDCKRYSQRRRTSKVEINMSAPQLNMIAGTTPSYLNNLMPEGAWDQGFISRVVMVYSGEHVLRPLMLDMDLAEDNELWNSLRDDLKLIGELYGKASFTEPAADAIKEWYSRRGEPQPDHPRLLHYNARRPLQLLKLCVVASAQRSDDLIIELEDYQTALGWLLEAEKFMPDIFKSMRRGGDSNVFEETWHFAYTVWMKEQKPILEQRLLEFISHRTPAHNVSRILELMVKTGVLEHRHERIGSCYVPRAREP